MHTKPVALAVGVLTMIVASSGVRAADPCEAPKDGWSLLPAVEPASGGMGASLRIVALGSSSTQGIGASGAAMTYPAQLQRLLQERYSGVPVEVINRGTAGETVSDNLARLERDVLALTPTLVIWQAGTNDALLDRDLATVAAEVARGVARIRAVGVDVALMTPQPLPDAANDAAMRRISDVLRAVALATATPLLDRYRLMRHWREAGVIPADRMIGPDGLHMTDSSYRCLAVRLAELMPALIDPAVVR